MTTTTVCTNCAGARWVAVDDPTAPWHAGGCGGPGGGQPCPACNLGPAFYPWHDKCLRCATADEFLVSLDGDDRDAVLATMFEQLADIDEPDTHDYDDQADDQVRAEFDAVHDQLVAAGETEGPTTPAGRLLHSKRAALLIEMSRRQMH